MSLSSPSLTDLATLKRYLSIATLNSDAKLANLIPDQSAAFLTETGRTSFDVTTYTEVRDGLGVDMMQLAYWPVLSVASLTKNGRVLPLSTGWNSWGYQFDALGKITLICDTFSCSPSISFNRKNVTVVYSAGYPTVTVSGELQTIPPAPTTPGVSWPQAATIYVLQPNWRSDVGISFFGGAALTPASGPPAAGQYFVLGNGGYLFNAADIGKQVVLSYVAAGYPSDMVGAVNRMVALRYYQQGHEDKRQDRLGDGATITYSKEDYPKDVWRIINNYKKFFFTPGF